MVDLEEKKDKLYKKRLRISQEEKNAIEMIAASIGKEYEDVKDVFIGLSAYIAMKLYEGEKKFFIPYLFSFELNVKEKPLRTNVEVQEEYKIETSNPFKNIIEKIHSDKTTWVEEFFQAVLFEQIKEKIHE